MKTRETFSNYLFDRLESVNISTKDTLANSFQNYLMRVVEFQRGKKATKEFLKSCLIDPINNVYKLGDFYYTWQDNKHIIGLKNTNYLYKFFDNGSLTFDTILFLSTLNIENEIQYLELKIKNILYFLNNKISNIIKIFKDSGCEIIVNSKDIVEKNLMENLGFIHIKGKYYDKNIEFSINWQHLFICSQQSLDNLMTMLPFLNIYFNGHSLWINYDENLDIFQFC